MRWRLFKLDYPYLLGELVIVVLGVAIALTADRWRQDFQDRELEADYIARLYTDIRAGLEVLGLRDTQIKMATAANRKLLGMLSDENSTIDTEELALTFAVAARIGFTSADIAHDVTYEELRDSGRLAILSDTGMRESLAEYYRRIDVLSSVWEDKPILLINRIERLTGSYPSALINIDGSNVTLTAEMMTNIRSDLMANRLAVIDELNIEHANEVLIQNRMDAARAGNAEMLTLLEQY